MRWRSSQREGRARQLPVYCESHGRPLEGSALHQKVPWLPGAWRQEGAPTGSARSMATGRETAAVAEVGDKAICLWRLTPVSSPSFRRANTQVCDLTNWVDSAGSSRRTWSQTSRLETKCIFHFVVWGQVDSSHVVVAVPTPVVRSFLHSLKKCQARLMCGRTVLSAGDTAVNAGGRVLLLREPVCAQQRFRCYGETQIQKYEHIFLKRGNNSY